MPAIVVDSSNLVEFTQTGKVPEFKPPEAAKPAAGDGTPPAAKSPAPGETPPAGTPARDATGKFTKPEGSDKTPTAPSKSPATVDADGEEVDASLPEAVTKAIGKKHRQMKEAEERERRETLRAIAAESEAANLKRQLEEVQSKSRPAPVKEPPKEPKQEDFSTIGEYTEALVNYRVDQRLREQKDAEQREAEQRAKESRAREFGQRMASVREKHGDFDQVLRTISGTDLDRVHTDVTEYLEESEHGPELIYHLAKNPDVLGRLQKLSPRRFIAELGKLETKFDKAPESAPKEETPTLTQVAAASANPVSKAPAPIAPLATGVAPVPKNPAEMSVSELREFRRNQAREQRANGRR